MCLYSIITSILSILSNGNNSDYNSGLTYTFISTSGCYFIYLLLKFKNKNLKSKLIFIEIQQWLLDTILSFAILISFLIILFFYQIKYINIVPYVEPTILIILSIFCLYQNLKIFLSYICVSKKEYNILKE